MFRPLTWLMRGTRSLVAPFDEDAVDPSDPKLNRQRKPNRTRADDQDGRRKTVVTDCATVSHSWWFHID